MKINKIKAIAATAVVAVAGLSLYAGSNDIGDIMKIRVRLTDGTTVEYQATELVCAEIEGESMQILMEDGTLASYHIDAVDCVDKCYEHGYVDLGLPSGLKWATSNIGAYTPMEEGDYFAWGETVTKSEYTPSNSQWYGMDYDSLLAQGVIDADGILTAVYDAATANWGGAWRMPTMDEARELINNCDWTYVYHQGVYVRKGTGPNGNSIILQPGSLGGCWTSALSRIDIDNKTFWYEPQLLMFDKVSLPDNASYLSDVYCGYPIRPVTQ